MQNLTRYTERGAAAIIWHLAEVHQRIPNPIALFADETWRVSKGKQWGEG